MSSPCTSAGGGAPSTSPRLFLSRWIYYLSSIPTILFRVRPLFRTLGAFLGLSIGPFTIRLDDGCRFRVRNRMDLWIIKETCLDRDYERGAGRVEDGWTVMDIGAGLGEFAICVAREHPNSVILAFEPLPESYALLAENARLNGLTNVRAFPEAIAGEPGPLFLHAPTGVAGQHRITRDAAAASVAGPVPATTLDRAFKRLGIERCDFLKIDVEGAEYEILFAASPATLARIARIALEYHDGVTSRSHQDLARFLEERGFRVRTRPNPAHEWLGFLFATNERA